MIDWTSPQVIPNFPPPNWALRPSAAQSVQFEEQIPVFVRGVAAKLGTASGLLFRVREGAAAGAVYVVGNLPDGQTPGPTSVWPLISLTGQAVAAALARAEAVSTALLPLTTGDGLVLLPRLDGTTLMLLPPSITFAASTYTLRGRVLPTIKLTGATP